MKNQTKFAAIIIALFTIGTGFTGIAGEYDGDKLKKGEVKAAPTAAPMIVEVLDNKGNVEYTNVITLSDPTLDFDLQSMPVGNYVVSVSVGEEVINATAMHNVSHDAKTITVEVIDAYGDQVFESDKAYESFDLASLPEGTFSINIYQGHTLINTSQLKN